MRAAVYLGLALGLTLTASGFADDKSKEPKSKEEKAKEEKAKEVLAKEALKKLGGRWIVDSIRAEGEDLDNEKERECTIDGDILTIKAKGDLKKEEFTLKVYPWETPKAIDLTKDDYVFRFIYEIKGDTLKLCIWKEEPAKRALEFTGERGHALAILKRPKS